MFKCVQIIMRLGICF